MGFFAGAMVRIMTLDGFSGNKGESRRRGESKSGGESGRGVIRGTKKGKATSEMKKDEANSRTKRPKPTYEIQKITDAERNAPNLSSVSSAFVIQPNKATGQASPEESGEEEAAKADFARELKEKKQLMQQRKEKADAEARARPKPDAEAEPKAKPKPKPRPKPGKEPTRKEPAPRPTARTNNDPGAARPPPTARERATALVRARARARAQARSQGHAPPSRTWRRRRTTG